jgi:hypothetical protein
MKSKGKKGKNEDKFLLKPKTEDEELQIKELQLKKKILEEKLSKIYDKFSRF